MITPFHMVCPQIRLVFSSWLPPVWFMFILYPNNASAAYYTKSAAQTAAQSAAESAAAFQLFNLSTFQLAKPNFSTSQPAPPFKLIQ